MCINSVHDVYLRCRINRGMGVGVGVINLVVTRGKQFFGQKQGKMKEKIGIVSSHFY